MNINTCVHLADIINIKQVWTSGGHYEYKTLVHMDGGHDEYKTPVDIWWML